MTITWDKHILNLEKIKFIGEADTRINEDYLRIMRYFRFLAYYGREPYDQESLRACKDLAGNLTKLSAERIQNELFKILSADSYFEIIALMMLSNILSVLIPNVEINLNNLQKLSDFELDYGPRIKLRLVLLISTITKAELNEIAVKLKLKNKDKKYLADVLFKELPSHEHQALSKYSKDDYIDKLIFKSIFDKSDISQKIITARRWQPIICPINGDDLLAKNVPAGKKNWSFTKTS